MELINVKLFDGNLFYYRADILGDDKLRLLYNTAIAFKSFAHLIKEMNNENALVIIHIDQEHEIVGNVELLNASAELYRKFINS